MSVSTLKLRRFSRLRQLALVLLVATAGAASALVMSARWLWLGELAASFQWHLGLGLVLVAGACVVLRARRLATLVAVASGFLLAPELALYIGEPAAASGSPELVLVSANVLQPNRHHREIADALLASEGDVIAVVELSKPMRAELERRLERWPHRVFSPAGEWSEQTWGMGVFSRLPFREGERLYLPETYAPSLDLKLERDGTPLDLRVVHLPRPGAEDWRVEARNEALAELATRLEWTGTSALVGDLNTTSTSPVFPDLLESTGLRDSRQGFGRCVSWHLRSLRYPLGIAIDHALVGRDLQVLSRETFELPFSDHEGIRVRLALPTPRLAQARPVVDAGSASR